MDGADNKSVLFARKLTSSGLDHKRFLAIVFILLLTGCITFPTGRAFEIHQPRRFLQTGLAAGASQEEASESIHHTKRSPFRFLRFWMVFHRPKNSKVSAAVATAKEKMDSESNSSATTHSGSVSSSSSARGRRLQRMIHALSFERVPRNSKKSSQEQNQQVPTENVLVPATPHPIAERSASVETLSESCSVLSHVVIQANNQNKTAVVKGTLLDDDSDGVEVVFYEAMEVGDGSDDDDFDSTNPSRDVVVLDNIIAVKGGSFDDSIEITTSETIGTGLAPPPEPIPFLQRDPTWVDPPYPPQAPVQLPLRFLRAGKGDPVEGARRYKATLAWRRENKIDTILREPNPHFDVIKKNYPHFCHGKGYNGEPCYYEQPPKADLKAMRNAGAGLEQLLRHYAMVTEFQWQYLVRDDLTRSIYIIDLEGMKFTDFAGEVVDFVKKASALSSQHYPERAGVVYVINVPGWFKMIWNVIKPWVDETTLKKIFILRDKEEIRRSMEEKIPPQNLPKEYGGRSPYPLGQSPEEKTFADLVAHNNRVAQGDVSCGGAAFGSKCPFCTWAPPRSY